MSALTAICTVMDNQMSLLRSMFCEMLAHLIVPHSRTRHQRTRFDSRYKQNSLPKNARHTTIRVWTRAQRVPLPLQMIHFCVLDFVCLNSKTYKRRILFSELLAVQIERQTNGIENNG